MKKSFFGLLILISINSNAQVKINEELNTLINKSFHFFSKSKEVENSLLVANEKLKSVKMSRNPDLDASGSYNYIMPKISFPINGNEVQFAPVNNFAASIGSSYVLFDFGRIKTNIAKVKSELQFSKDNIESSKHQLANQVAMIYYNIVYFKKAIQLQDSIINYYKENKKWVSNKFKSGDMLELDIYNLQSSIDIEENKKIDLTASLQKQIELLDYVTGTNQANGTAFDFDNQSDSFSANNPEIILAKDKVNIAKKELSVIKLNNKPSIGIRAGAGYRNGFVPEVEDMRFNYMAGLFLNIPIYNFGKTKQQIKLQQSLVKQAELAEESIINSNKKDIAQTQIDINANTERLKNYESQIEAGKKALVITTSRYKNGIATYLDVANAIATLQKINLYQLQCEYQLCLAKIELNRLTGNSFWK